MGISFRGTASRLKQMTEKRNAAGFQEKSAAGPRDGVGGEKVSVDEAAKKFAARSSSPFKLKNRSIMAKTSPMKINMALVQGARDVSESGGYRNPADAVASAFQEQNPEPIAFDVGQCKDDEYKDSKGNCLKKPECDQGQVFNPTSAACEDPVEKGECPEGQIKNETGACVKDPKAPEELKEEDLPENTSPEDISN